MAISITRRTPSRHASHPARIAVEAIAKRSHAEDALDKLTESFGRSVDAGAVVLAELHPGRRQAIKRAAWTRDGSIRTDPEILDGLVSEVAEAEESRLISVPADAEGLLDRGYLVGVPVWRDQGRIYVMVVSLADRLDELDSVLESTRDCAAVAALCLRHLSELEGLRHAASHDELTGCLNRISTRSALSDEMAKCERHDWPLSVCLIDLDRFKAINDNHGHLVGDQVLREVGRALRETTRRYEIVGRIGGDEFLIVMPQTAPNQGAAAARRFIRAVDGLSVEGAGGPLSATVGLAQWRSGDGVDDLLGEADAGLRAVKSAR
jgi:diguanylate cyclase (GGDEF)-like protein